jgi:hypothetical protein
VASWRRPKLNDEPDRRNLTARDRGLRPGFGASRAGELWAGKSQARQEIEDATTDAEPAAKARNQQREKLGWRPARERAEPRRSADRWRKSEQEEICRALGALARETKKSSGSMNGTQARGGNPGSTRSCPRTEDQNRRRRRALLAKREPRKTLSAIENLAARGDPQGANYDVTFELRFTQPTGDRLTRNSRSHAADRKQYQRAELKSHSKKSIVQIQHKGKNERHKQHKKSIFLL